MKQSTQWTIRDIVSKFIDDIPAIDRSSIEQIRKAYPFQAAIFSEEAILYAKQERSIVTRMGMILYPSLAALIARDKYSDVRTEHDISIEIDSGCLAEIDRVVNELREGGGKRSPNHAKEMKTILESENNRITHTKLRADLFIGDYSEGPLFMEIKSPMPNIDMCAQTKKKILVFETVNHKEKGRAYLAFAYNPWIVREKYAHSFTKTVMDLKEEVLMGSEMWDKIGGQGTFVELLKIVANTANQKRSDVKSREQTF